MTETGTGIRPHQVMTAIRQAIEESGEFPNRMTYLEREPDITGRDAGIKLPLLTIQPVSNIRITDFNTDRVGWVTDDEGNTVGRVFAAEYQLDLQLDVWTVTGSSTDVNTLGDGLYDTLYEFDSAGPAQPFLDANGAPIESIWRFNVRDGEPANDYSMTPSLRRWRQDVSVWAYHRFDTSADYIKTVSYPDDLSDTNDDGTLSS